MSPSTPLPSLPEPAGSTLLGIIRSRILDRGPIPFADFMDLALYHPEEGYYGGRRDPIGRDAGKDYYTAPSRHPAFGATLERQVAECLAEVGGRAPELVEFGPGDGSLMASLLGALRDDPVASRIEPRCTLVEANPHRREAQRRKLDEAGFRARLRWVTPSEWTSSTQRFRGCVIANEVLDALPVHRLVFRNNEWAEIHVDWKEGLVEIIRPPSSPALLEELRQHRFSPREGQEVEVGLEAIRWIHHVASRLGRGYLVVVDYGHLAPEIYSHRHQRGTLLAYHHHQVREEYLERVGEQDLTTHVNFSSVLAAARRAGLVRCGLVSQGRFLLALGILDRFRPLRGSFDWNEYRDRKAMQDLFLPGRMGESHQVLILGTPGLKRDLIGLRSPDRWGPPEAESHGSAPAACEGG